MNREQIPHVGVNDLQAPRLYDAAATFPIQPTGKIDQRMLVFGEASYLVTIFPAVLRHNDGTVSEVMPGSREEIIERTLRHLFTAQAKALDQDPASRENHTLECLLWDLDLILRHLGFEFTCDEIERSLEILNRSHLQVTSTDPRRPCSFGGSFVSSCRRSFLSGRGGKPITALTITLNNLSRRSTQRMAASSLNFHQLMKLESSLARWLAVQLQDHWETQLGREASVPCPFRISLHEITQTSGVRFSGTVDESLLMVRAAVRDLGEAFLHPDRPFDETFTGSPGNEQPTWTLHPNREFFDRMDRLKG